MQVSIKNVDERIFREFKADAVREGLSIGNALNLTMELWLQKKNKKPKMTLLDFKPRDWGRGTEKTSEEIDKIVY